MPTLHELQADFRRYLLGGDAAAIAATVAIDGLAPAQRLQIYRNHVGISLREALKTSYATVASLVGEEFFAAMCASFIDTHPPAGPCLAEYGGEFPDYVAAYEPARGIAYLADAARLDWALNEAYCAPEAAPIEVTALAEIDPDNYGALRLRLQPSLRYLRSDYPLKRIWEVSQPDAPADARVDLQAGGVHLEIRRSGERAIFRALNPGAWQWRNALAQGASLGDSVMALGRDKEFDLNVELPAIFAQGLVCGLAVGT